MQVRAGGIDVSSKEPMYAQLYDILFQDIVNQVYRIGDRIPSESELVERYGVSRITARRAMEMLANNGLIEKRRGYGSVVVSSVPVTSLQRVRTYACDPVRPGPFPSKRQIRADIVPAQSGVAEVMGVAPGTELFRLVRLHLLGEVPAFLEFNYYEHELFPDATVRDFVHGSLRSYVNNACGVTWKHASQIVSATAADSLAARLLDVEEGAPLLQMQRITTDVTGRFKEFVDALYRPEMYRVRIELEP